MPDPEFFDFGKIVRTHGHKGWLRGTYDGRHPEHFQKLESVFLQMEEQPVPFFIDTIQWEGNRFMVKFNEINSMEEASAILGKKILLPISDLPELEEGDFYLHQLIGMEVVDQNSKSLGKVISFYDQTPQEMIEVDCKGKGLLIPLTEEIVVEIQLEKGKIEVELPDGYLKAFLDE